MLNRGVDKRAIVTDDGDRMRFVRSLYHFNDSRPAPNAVSQRTVSSDLSRKRDCLVKIHAWCLMDNHYHLLLSPVDNDLTKLSLFIKKLNGGYAKFFNDKHDRTGYLWQGKTKKIRIERSGHFLHIPYYIHMNPLDHILKEWREGDLKDVDTAVQHLDNYRWSSWQDYTGARNFPSIIYKEMLSGILKTKEAQIEVIRSIGQDQSIASKSDTIET